LEDHSDSRIILYLITTHAAKMNEQHGSVITNEHEEEQQTYPGSPNIGRMDDTHDFDMTFSFPARTSVSNTPDRRAPRGSVAGTHGTPTLPAYSFPAAPSNQVNQASSAFSQLQAFSFPSTSSSSQTSPLLTSSGGLSMPATPTAAARGHRRTASEFVGGDASLGSATKFRHASVDGGGGYGTGVAVTESIEPFRRPHTGHGRKSSMSSTPLRQALIPEVPQIDLDASAASVDRKSSGDNTPRAVQSTTAGQAMSGGYHTRSSSTGYTPTRQPIPRPRVAFANQFNRLSTISSQSGSSDATVRGHSASLSSASAPFTGSPLGSPLRNTEEVSFKTAESLSAAAMPRLSSNVARPSTSASTSPSRKPNIEARPKSAQAFSAFDKGYGGHETSKNLKNDNTKEPTSKPKRILPSWAPRFGRHSKSSLPPHVSSAQLNIATPQDASTEVSAEPSPEPSGPVAFSTDLDSDPTVVVEAPSEPAWSESAPSQTNHTRSAPFTKVTEEDNSGMIDLDVALDPFVAPPESRTPKGKSFSAARKVMHSGHGTTGVPIGHRRAESAPPSVFFDSEQGRIVDSATSCRSFEMEDVFEEDDEFKELDGPAPSMKEFSASASGTTSFEADRGNISDSSMRPSSSHTTTGVRFEDPSRRLHFNRNSSSNLSPYRRQLAALSSYRPQYAGSAASSEGPTTPELSITDSFGTTQHGIEQGNLKEQRSASLRGYPAMSESPGDSSYTSPSALAQSLFDNQHRGSTTTAATSFADSNKTPSISHGEPGPKAPSPADISLAPRAPLQPLSVNKKVQGGGLRSVSSTMSVASAAPSAARRKRSSLGNLSRLLYGNKSSVSLAPAEEPKTPKGARRLSRVFRFWRKSTPERE
jgi:hypothetical protein